jgi:hypothetical protein
MPRRPVRLGWTDFLVVTAATLTFTVAVLSQHQHRLSAPPSEETIQAMATELGVTTYEFHRAIEEVPPPPPGTRGTEAGRAEHCQLLAAALAVPPARLNAVLEKYRPLRRF